jgi:DNA invertase Pin-like site-specific DNA recombinase
MRLKAQAGRARLIVAKLDRLSRDARFLLELVDSGVDVVFGDFPDLATGDIVGRLTLTVLAAIAEFESRRMSQRQREAAAVRRARGDLMGGRDPRSHRLTSAEIKKGNLSAILARRQRASTFRRAMRPVIATLRDKGRTLKEVANELNICGYRTRKGKLWTAATVALLTGAAAPWEAYFRGANHSIIE